MPDNAAENHILLNYSKQDILKELDCILNSELFSRTAVLCNFLKFIVEETLEGHTHSLKEYTIAVSALGKSVDFNPQTDAVVRIHAGRLRRLLNEYYLQPGITDSIKIEVIKGTYVPVFRTQVIEKSTEDLREKTTTVVNDTVVYSRSRLTLAVLPFRNLLPNKDYQFFVDGFGEELTRVFSTSEDLDVIAHFSTLKYVANPKDIRVVGSELGVHYVIAGAVKRSAKQIKVSVGLGETVNGMQIWTKDYIHSLEDDEIMDIQDQINNDVFALLSGHYGFIIKDTMRLVEGNMKQDLQAFDAVLWFHHAQLTHSEENFLEAIKGLEKTLENDPNNVMCLSILGDLYLSSYSMGYTVEDPINKANLYIEKAIRIAPLSQYAHMERGWAHIHLGKKKEAIESLKYSEQLASPSFSPSTMGGLGFAYSCVGEYKCSHALLQAALNLNPYCPWWYYVGLFFGFYHNGQYEEAFKYAQKMNASEDVYVIPLLMVAVKGQLGMVLEARVEINILNKKFPEILANLGMYLNSFILDRSLVEEIILGLKKAGLQLH
ncbi:tetratricopeptide repeat protein [Bizionia arctica]|uniref:Tetratricopeptide repeat protein n=1 Tax=Bizionia arctica TaxID=1495645 RepID=A0A917GI91_9FLAO|nr:hypothetical protein [Bizionia arctica]GGG47349.1 hypothetical protein GCM10010976_18440 [Bizionia arctica]